MSVIPEPGVWADAGAATELVPGALRTWKQGSAQLVIGRTQAGDIFALDNRCPHEGYPLTQGDLKDTTLTCCWHNWKFDIRNGACLRGGEDVRRYPTRVQAGRIQVELTPPPTDVEIERLRQSLALALQDGDLERAMRDSLRLLAIGYPFERVVGDVALFDARHAEDGATHVTALAAETLQLAAGTESAERAWALAPLLELASESLQRLPERKMGAAPPENGRLAPMAPTASAVRQAVESEDLEAAEAGLRAAYAGGAGWREIEAWLFAVVSDHFLSFGHPLIYLIKSRQLLDVLPAEYFAPIHASLLFGAGNATREDTLPYLRSYFVPVREWARDFAELPPDPATLGTPPQTVRDAALGGKPQQAMHAVWEALQQGLGRGAVAQALVLAASERLLRFDLRLDSDPEVQEDWLFATHRLTFACAVRQAMLRFDAPESIHLLFQAAAFIHSGAPMDVAEPRCLDACGKSDGASLDPLRTAVLARRTDEALEKTLQAWRGDGDREALERLLVRCAVDAPLVRPIYRVHAIKTTLAGIEASRDLRGIEDGVLPLLAAVRFLASPVHERGTEAAAHAAVQWVEHGRQVRKLTQ